MTGQWFSPGAPISSINKTDRHDIQVTEILLIVALNTIHPNHLLKSSIYYNINKIKVEEIGNENLYVYFNFSFHNIQNMITLSYKTHKITYFTTTLRVAFSFIHPR
jgi:hypothetical protein